MAQYKVIQDIEAEDKLLGPLTLKQFIYAAVTVVAGFLAYKFAYAFHSPYIIILFLPIIIFFGLLAIPFGIEQPNEVWLLAKFRFFLKPQVRRWDQDGIGSLVTVTVPKKISKKLTKDFTATEAKSRLESLAKILDTGGWATANLNATVFSPMGSNRSSDDRLVDLNSIASGQPTADIIDQDDIFDENNLQAQHINSVMAESEKRIKDYQKNLMESPNTSRQIISSSPRYLVSKDYIDEAPEVPAFGPIESRFNPQNTIQINSPAENLPQNDQPSVTTQPDNAKIRLSAEDNNRSVASLARDFRSGDDPNEVVIHFH